ncbi:hypothetical protein BAJUN_00340 [Bajunvirus bajun]|uniref:Uncharacterized protein n=1 Tax=Brevundimonas phage vB_BgoS-Bajun TaxID=2948594 RepID=A0A9E7N4K0_9CAUD|nr:hypothetical protein BAJUN_00340 [Brevundimonas phage vB_BgoS-Bajun]
MTADCNVVEITHDRLNKRQASAMAWVEKIYGPRVKGTRYQALRFLEEAMELAQTQGLSLEDFNMVGAYVASRPVGDTKVEIGDVTFCLDVLAENLGLSVDSCHTNALLRFRGRDESKALAKDDAKCAAGLI